MRTHGRPLKPLGKKQNVLVSFAPELVVGPYGVDGVSTDQPDGVLANRGTNARDFAKFDSRCAF